MKRLIAVVMSLCLCVTFTLPVTAFADEPYSGPDTPAESIEQTQTFDPYAAYDFVAAHKSGGVSLPKGFEPKVSKVGNGVLVTVPKKYAGERIAVSDKFEFTQGAVDRFLFDGLAERNSDAHISFFLDDAASPFATFELAWASGKTDWEPAGDNMHVLAGALQGGPHALSFSLDTGGKKTQVLLRKFLFMQQTGLPTVEFDIDESKGSIDRMNNSENHSRECYGSVNVHVPAGYKYEYTGAVADEDTTTSYKLAYVRGRGNSTWMNDKKPYKVKLDKKGDLLGMGANKHWILLANRYDPSLMRNKITYWLGQELGMKYTPKCAFVDVVMNGTYYGSYYLCEQIRVGESRVNITELEEKAFEASEAPDLTGGYLLNMDYGKDQSIPIATERGTEFSVESPALEEWEEQAHVDAAVNYLKGYLDKVDAAVYGEGFKDADGKGYDEYLDVDAAIDYYWMQMFTMNGDAYGSGSTYLFKDREGTENAKLNWGPLWDFDYVAWGDLEYGEYVTEGFSTESAPWLSRLLQDETFCSKMIARWSTLKEKLQQITCKGGKLDEYAAQLALSQRYDAAKWGAYSEGGGDYGYGRHEEAQEQRSYADEVEQLRGWIEQRVEWVDGNIESLKPVTTTVTFKDRGKTVATRDIMLGTEIGSLPDAGKRPGYVFAGWVLEEDEDGFAMPLDASSIIMVENPIVNATWIKRSESVSVQKLSLLFREAYVGMGTGYYDDETTFYMPYDVYPFDASDTRVTWTSSDTDIATVDESGMVQARALGTVTITGTCANGVKASYKLHFITYDDEDVAWSEGLEIDKDNIVMRVGEARKINAQLQPQPCRYADVEWTSLDEDVATVYGSGLVVANQPGTTYIFVKSDAMYDTYERCKVTVLPNDVSAAKVKLKKASVVYNGKKKTPRIKYVKLDGKKLRRGKDYTLTLPKNCKRVGAYEVTIEGIGGYVGTKAVAFKVLPPKAKLAKPKTTKGTIKVKVKKLSKTKLKQVSGYQVRWSASKKFTSFKSVGLAVSKKKARATLGKIKPGKRHYIQVRTYKTVKGEKYYSPWSNAVSAK